MSTTAHTTPLRSLPAWAVLQRRLFSEIEDARRLFVERYTNPDGSLRGIAAFADRDGVDDLYEPFFNWPAFYLLGGPDDALSDAKRHWEGVTAQLSSAGMLTDEYENGYDWFHQGESALLFLGICAADPRDERFAERAQRFAALYTDTRHGNHDAERNIIRAPHNGALGARRGLEDGVPQPYSAALTEMRPYGLPVQGIDGIAEWDDLADPENARRMAEEMQRRAVGDVAVNLAATSLVANAWLYDGDARSASWVTRYVDGWMARAAANNGLLPDNVAPDGTVGGLQDGRWWGGHYGWAWPHGLHSVAMSALIGGLNAALITDDDRPLDMVRTMLDTVLEHGIRGSVDSSDYSLRGEWKFRFGVASADDCLLVPYRHGADGWFDFGPLQLDLPTWLWWWSRSDADRARLDRAIDGLPSTLDPVGEFRDKEEAGHEAGWIRFLDGALPEYPERALAMALGQVARRVALMRTDGDDPDGAHLHFWQRVNPVVTEVLSQLVTGTPQVLYNGGLPFSAIDYADADLGRPGLPQDVAALVDRLESDTIGIRLVNTSTTRARRVRILAGRFSRTRIASAAVTAEGDDGYPGPSGAYAGTRVEPSTRTVECPDGTLTVELAPAHAAELTLTLTRTRSAPHHRTDEGTS
ncbi:hypothetical protein OED01_01580 [Microbacterium sp. M28]|uniref:hypothetical protein n=1 Tax=Microbacterium sp. M28 TaxID=2962064 RepID=UPI0021F42983|nr:hypothetical protein [Microbacterium sp. M28]UYO97449.1 hypothetical protein OED01_01580 [Microbacterium sp. M28]